MNALIMWGLTIWVPVLLCVLNINEAKFKKNLAVGVTFPLKGRADGIGMRRSAWSSRD